MRSFIAAIKSALIGLAVGGFVVMGLLTAAPAAAQTVKGCLGIPNSAGAALAVACGSVPTTLTVTSGAGVTEDFGTCHGIDDTTILAAALALVGNGSVITLPNTTCAYSSALVAPIANSVTIRGSGQQSFLTYVGASTVVPELFTVGTLTIPSGNSCQITGWTLDGFSMTSNTAMTSGDGLLLAHSCNTYIHNVSVGLVLGSGNNNHFFNAVHIYSGNTVQFQSFAFRGSNADQLVNGDGTFPAYGIVDHEGQLANGGIGLQLGGEAAVLVDQTRIFLNGTNVSVDQSQGVGFNLQLFLGPQAIVDEETGGAGIGLSVTDTGSATSVLTLPGWIASSTNECIYIGPGAVWRVIGNDGVIFACGGDGLQNNSTAVQITISGTLIANNGGYGVDNAVSNSKISLVGNGGKGTNILGDINGATELQSDSTGLVDNGNLTLNLSAGPIFTPASPESLQNVDGVATGLALDSSQSTSVLSLRSIQGTFASKGASSASNSIGEILFGGYNGAMSENGAAILCTPQVTWTGSTYETRCALDTTPSGSTSLETELTWDGGIGLGALSPQGVGTINASNYFLNGGNISAIYAGLAAANVFTNNQTINLSTGSLLSGTPTNGLTVQAVDASAGQTIINSSQNFSQMYLERTQGTFASPTTLLSGEVLGLFGIGGYDGSAVIFGATQIETKATANWVHGTTTEAQLLLRATPPSSTAIETEATLGGGVALGAAALEGLGTLDATNLFVNGANISTVYAPITVPLSDLAAQAANTVVANVTSGSAAPTAFAMPSCGSGNNGNALQWTPATGFVCNTGLIQAHSVTPSTIGISPTAITVSAGGIFGTAPAITANGSLSAKITVGTSPAATVGSIVLPTATTGWHCTADDLTTLTEVLHQTTSGVTGAGFVAYAITTGLATAPTGGDVLQVSCTGD